MKNTTLFFVGKSYSAPTIDTYSVKAEKGFFVSQNPGLSYGSEGAAGSLENGNSYEL